ncbi:MAG: ADP-glyceromanno-heptose 6-epimerase [Hyphomonadaceae bacterium]|nr:ADP-glyceromanno-heptose 6-epimerase [Hyphomonadaceae bacterium]
MRRGERLLHLVTGGAGFIGSNVAEALALRGERVVISDWFEVGDKWRNLAGVALHDIIRPDALFAWLGNNASNVASVIHMGAISATTERDGDRLVSENIRLTLDLWEWCAREQKSFIYASSAATYGDGAAGFDDDWSLAGLARLKPLNAYGWSKHMVDRRISRDVADGRPTPPVWAGLKFFNVYGPHEFHKGPMRSVALQLFETISKGENVKLFRSHRPDFKDGGQSRDFVYVADCVSVVEWLLTQRQIGGIFNVGSGQARSFLDLASAAFTTLDLPADIAFTDTPIEIRDKYQYFTQANIDNLRAAGYTADFYTLEAGVRDYMTFLKSRPG